MAIPSITGVGRVSVTSADTPSTTSAAARPPQALPVEIDEITQQPLPPRFPWLSRLSHQLESASGQRPAFSPAPLLGDHVDQQV
ncbi:hypothetical protein [Rhizobacter sp. Root404]|jgi:hypothetical protein|uniref:hypothetical protein n=1 Tax=Rhizobacter sp. Root404 TaxID=1736528 RepID=UPI0006F7FF95|nr:hypothetical protein [Rhizobacter sp. Root404]KQW40425.1 hypothetical protein ASC76_03035 [Rhizobacter sp. Root404]